MEEREKLRKNYKCYGCVWGKWTGIKYFCVMPRCIKEDKDVSKDI